MRLHAANGSWRDPRHDRHDLFVRDRVVIWSTQQCKDIGGGSPAFLMTDQGKVDWQVIHPNSYTGNRVTHSRVISPGNPSMSSVVRYCCSEAPRNSLVVRPTPGKEAFMQLPWQTSQ